MALTLSVGPLPGSTLGEVELRQAWRAHGGRVLEDEPVSPAGPWGYWRFAAGVPDDLRGDVPALYPLEDRDEIERQRVALHARRAAWLAR